MRRTVTRRRLLQRGGAFLTGLAGIGRTIGQSTGQVSGRVLSKFDVPLPEAEIAIYDSGGGSQSPLVSIQADQRGRFAIEPPERRRETVVVVNHPGSGYCLLERNSGLPTGEEIEFRAPVQKLFGPEPVRLPGGGTQLFVCVYRVLGGERDGRISEQTLAIELIGPRDEADGEAGLLAETRPRDILPLAAPGFDLSVPEQGIAIQYPSESRPADGAHLSIIPNKPGPPLDREESLHRWHPGRTSLPGSYAASGDFRVLTESYARHQRNATPSAVVRETATALPGISAVAGVFGELGQFTDADGGTRRALGDGVSQPPDRNEFDSVSQRLQFGVSAVVLRVPIRFEERGRYPIVAESSWRGSPWEQADRISFQDEFTISTTSPLRPSGSGPQNGESADDADDSSSDSASLPVPFTESFDEGVSGWTVGLHPDASDRASEADGAWSPEYGGSVKLTTEGDPQQIGVWRAVEAMPEGTVIASQYDAVDTLLGQRGGPRLKVHPPDGRPIPIDFDDGDDGDNDGRLSGRLPRDLSAGSEIEFRLGTRSGAIQVYLQEISATLPESRQASQDEGWPQFGFDALNSGYAPENVGAAETLETEWHHEFESLATTVAGGTVYAANDRLVAVSLADGTRRWEYAPDGADSLTHPIVSDGTVFVGSRNGSVYAVSASDGTPKWDTNLGGETVSPPTIRNGILYVGTHGGVHTLSPATGEQLHGFEFDDTVGVETKALASTPAVGADAVVCATAGRSEVAAGTVYGLSKRAEELWRYEPSNYLGATPAISGETAVLGVADGTVALSLEDGSRRWKVESSNVRVSPAVTAETVYSLSRTSVLRAINISDGSVRWTAQYGPEVGDERSTPAVVDDAVFYTVGDTLYVVSTADGSLTASTDIGSGTDQPVVTNGRVIVGTDAGITVLAPE